MTSIKSNNYVSKVKVSEVISFSLKLMNDQYLVLPYNTCTYVIQSNMLHSMFSDELYSVNAFFVSW